MNLKIKHFIIFLCLGIIGLSCTDTSEPDDLNNFFFKITVVNSSGNPVQGLRITTWNDLSIGLNNQLNNEINSINSPVTIITFDIAKNSDTEIKIYDLNNNLKAILLDTIILAGRYSYAWNSLGVSQEYLYSGVYKCRLIAKEISDGSLLYRDSIYMVLWRAPDATLESIGYTTDKGEFITENTLLFPYLFNLPPIPSTSLNGPDIIGSCIFLNSANVVLIDTSQHKQQIFKVNIAGGKNEFKFIWNPTNRLYRNRNIIHHLTNAVLISGKFYTDSDSSVLPNIFKLYQNYPNPYN